MREIQITLTEKEIHLIIDNWRASNRFNALTSYKSDEIIREEMTLMQKLMGCK